MHALRRATTAMELGASGVLHVVREPWGTHAAVARNQASAAA
jgi:hypothetical protein